MTEIKRKKNESFEAFMRRVKKRWQQSGKLLQAKKIQFHAPNVSKNTRKTSTLHKIKVTKKIEYLRKTGNLPEEKTKSFRRR